ncbi:hypothetical protein [Actinoplanes awajinensis]|uniref:Squalene cyclase n=1 Tax=Actinoplanes awajinensis subsp. mycoplanecinus TaxID=135947 RepID=A0A124G9B0_9ACTN|nr:hypothetical protein [Actinoplanes awajinensis]KUL28557.1 hypothetical protein ADL15_31945 [Actinoplanes awajinensis subsp. mycoplanecinus]
MAVLDWLLDSDPAIRWQVLRDLVRAPEAEVAAERARIARAGWGARLLDCQGDDGQWDGGACFPGGWFDRDDTDEDLGQPWTSTLHTLQLLTGLGVDPADERVKRAVERARDNARWEYNGELFFLGEVEPCVNGRVVEIGAYFGHDVEDVLKRLLGAQLEDGGWNCYSENGSVVSSFASTLCVLDGLLAYQNATGGTPATIEARRRGEEYLLSRRLFRRRSTGAVVVPEWLEFSFPTRWRYDVLRALDYFRATGAEPDERLGEALDLVRAKQRPDGTWPLENTHPGQVWFALDEEADGAPSRWNTLRALRVLDHYA